MKERYVNTAILLGTLLFTVAVAEIAIRVFGHPQLSPPQYTADSVLVYRLRANVRNDRVRTRAVDYRWSSNSQAFRGTREYALPKPPGVRRILALGDSFIFGIGVDDTAAFPVRVEARLRTDCDKSLEIINGGVGGYNTSQELEMYEHYGRQYDPELVILGVLTNDFDDLAQFPLHVLQGDSAVPKPIAERPRDATAKRISEMIPGYAWLITHSAIVDGLRQVYYGLKWRSSPIKGIGQAVERVPDDRLVTLERALLRRLQARVAADSARLLVVLMPDEASAGLYYSGAPDRAGVMKVMRGLCSELSLDCLDMAEWLVTNMPNADLKKLYIQGDGHFSVAGQVALTNAIEPRVRELVGCAAGGQRE